MAFVPAPNCARVEMVYTQAGQTMENVYHVKLAAGPFSDSNLIDAAAAFKTWWDTRLKSNVRTEVTLVKILATALDSQTAVGIEYTTGLPIAGTNSSGAPLPNNVTVAIKWLTAARGRSLRGRTYHIGLSSTSVTASEITTAERSVLLTAYGNLFTDLVGLTPALTLSVVSYYSNNALRNSALITPIIDVGVDITLDSQRRRLPGRGQ